MVRRQRCYDTKLGRSRNFEGTFVSAPAAMEAAFHTRDFRCARRDPGRHLTQGNTLICDVQRCYLRLATYDLRESCIEAWRGE